MDIKLPGVDGLTAIEDVKKRSDAPILIITAYGTKKMPWTQSSVVQADFIKPIALDELKIMVKRVLGTQMLKKELEVSKEEELGQSIFHGVIGKSEVMKEIFKNVEKFADKDITVLITGETGAGKEAVGRLIHDLSKEVKTLWLLTCASIPGQPS